jgi:hypothetical protein
MRTLLAIAIGAALVLGYGYYHAATHGWLYINLMDTSIKPYAGNIRDAEVRLLASCWPMPNRIINTAWFGSFIPRPPIALRRSRTRRPRLRRGMNGRNVFKLCRPG